MVAHRESAELAKRLIADSCEKQNIAPGQLAIHADRGSSMTSKPVAFLMADLGVTKMHSRPYVSDDNPYSESQFRTMKYRPEFPDRFGSILRHAPMRRFSVRRCGSQSRHGEAVRRLPVRGTLVGSRPLPLSHGLVQPRVAVAARV
jgi:transposase InsO family protein